jgi:hypothetical protein
MTKPISAGAVLYMLGVTLAALFLFGQWREEKHQAAVNVGALYSVCRYVQAVAPHLVTPAPIPTTQQAAMAQASDPAGLHRSRIASICNDEHIEDFERISSRQAARAGREKKAQ